MARAYLGLGGNIGDARRSLGDAIARLEEGGARLVRRSGDYETPPWGKTDQPRFINACIAVETELEPVALLRLCLAVERALGRERGEKWAPRIIDIDIIDYEGRRMKSDELTLPHPLALERSFVLVPLAEIAPGLRIAGRRIADALAGLDTGGIRKLD